MKTHLLKFVLAGWFFGGLSGVCSLSAQTDSYDMTGVVRAEQSGEPLPHASVQILGTRLGAVTNSDGLFSIVRIPAQQASAIVVRYLGYKTKEIPLNPNIQTRQVVIELQEIGFEIDEIVIEAGTRQVMKSSGLSQISLNPAQIQNLPSLGERDIFRTLQLMPGISGTNESSSGLYVRGGTPDQNLILFDGFTVYHVDHFFGFFSAFNANAVKDVQLYKGGFGAKYGGRLSSVVELTGKQGNRSEFDMDAGVSMLSGNLSLEIPLGSKGSVILSGRHSYPGVNNGLYSDIFDLFVEEIESQNVTSDPTFQFYDANAKITLTPTDKDVLSISFYNGKDDLDNSRVIDVDRTRTTQRGIIGAIIHNDISDQLSWGNWGVSGKWSRKWNARWYSNMVLAGSNYFSRRNQLADGETTIFRRDTSITRQLNNSFVEDNDVRDFTLRIDNELKIGTHHTFEFGAQLTSHEISYLYARNDTNEILNRLDYGNLYAAYLEDAWSPVKGLEIRGGIRSTWFEPTEQLYWEPRASASYNWNKWTFKAAWGKYHQFTNRIVREDVLNGSRDFWVLADGNEVPVGEAYHYIAGLNYETDGLLIDVEVYEKQLKGLSEFSLRFNQQRRGQDPEAEEFFYTGTGVARGLEVLVQKTQGRFTGWLSYTLSEVVHEFPDLSDFAYYALHHQLHEWKLVQSLELGRWVLSGTWVYASGKPYTAPGGLYELTTLNGDEYDYINVGSKNSEQLPPYHRLDLSASHTFPIKRSKLQLGLSIFNAYNRRNIWYKEFEITGNELIETDFLLLGFTPNLYLNFHLK